MASVTLKDIKKIYPNTETKKKKHKKGEPEEKKHNLQITDEGVVAVQKFSLDIKDREFIVLVGPSGCGKSTTLRMIAGLEEITEGELYIGDRLVNDVAPKDRDIAMVFQNYALYPHMTVFENMAFSLKLKKVPKKEIEQKVREAAEILGITEYLDRKPKALSGGQRQRVAIGRDQTEAMTLGDRIVIMRDGFIQQIGTPQEVFNHPTNLFVAGFIGTPQMNFFHNAKLVKKDGEYAVDLLGRHIVLDAERQKVLKGRNEPEHELIVGIRPVHLTIAEKGLPATIDVSEMMGSEMHLHLNVEGQDVIAIIPTAGLSLDAVRSGSQTHFDFDPSLMHLFDPETEKNLF